MEVYIAGKSVSLAPDKAIGKGGEADVYDIGSGRALKLFKTKDHPDFAGFKEQQQEAKKRLLVHQKKLPAFPKDLPDRVIAPIDLVTNRAGKKIIGYTMALLENAEVLMRYGDKTFRQYGITAATIIEIFRDLHTTVATLHNKGIVIGDFNDLNILVRNQHAYLIDADSFQFNPYFCKVYTERFVDPLLCDQNALRPILERPYNCNSDWYAFAVMLFRSLLLVDPFGGVYKPQKTPLQIPHCARPLHGITVLHKDVRYPKPAYRYDILPDDLLQYFYKVFNQKQRQIFPRDILDRLYWKICPSCHLEYARPNCPACSSVAPAIVAAAVKVSSDITVHKIFETAGKIIEAVVNHKKLCYLVHKEGEFFRENAQPLFTGQLQKNMRFHLLPKTTLIASQNQLLVISDSDDYKRLQVDVCSGLPTVTSNESTYFWVQDGEIMRNGGLGPERIGSALTGQTLLWVGNDMGFGIYRAGEFNVGFVFNPKSSGINDSVRLPNMNGQLISITCKFASQRCWVIWKIKQNGQQIQHIAVLQNTGKIIASSSADLGEKQWIEFPEGALAIGKFLLVATDEGIMQLEQQQGQIAVSKSFPNTEPYVNAETKLLPGENGIYAVTSQTICLLRMN